MILKYSRIFAASLCVLLGAGASWAETPEGFYDQDQVRGFISLKGDFRHMRSEGINNLNGMLFDLERVGSSANAADLNDYSHFKNNYLGLHTDIGAEYKQFLTWFDVDFMPTQISERPAKQTSAGLPLYDISWNSYGANWMFGWKLLPQESPINLIPSVGIGLSLMNVHLGSVYMLVDKVDTTKYEITRDRSYSSFGQTLNTEIEARLQLGQFSVGGYAGYKIARYEEFNIEGFSAGPADLAADSWFVGGKVTWTMLSMWQRKQLDKI